MVTSYTRKPDGSYQVDSDKKKTAAASSDDVMRIARELFPMLEDEEYQALKRDIAENGQREPIRICDGEILDGRNRFKACEELGIAPKIQNVSREEVGDPIAYAMSLNFHRRHLKPHQKGAALAQYMDAVGARKQKGPGRPRKSTESVDLPTIATVAQKLGVPEQTARDHLKAASDYQAAAPELRIKVDAGELTPAKAKALTVKLTKEPTEDAIALKQMMAEPRRVLGDKLRQCLDWLAKYLDEHPNLKGEARPIVRAMLRLTGVDQ